MSDWRERLDAEVNQADSNAINEAGMQRAAAEAHLQDYYEPHLKAQELFWGILTKFLARHGTVMYEPPGYHFPRFSTGPMALQPVEIDSQGIDKPIPCIQVTSRAQELLQKQKPIRFPQSPEATQQKADVINRIHAAGEYVTIQASLVTYVDRIEDPRKVVNEHRGDVRKWKPLKGSYMPKANISKEELAIFPEAPPANYYDQLFDWKHTSSQTVVRSPQMPKFFLPPYSPPREGQSNRYNDWLQSSVDGHERRRDPSIATTAELTDMLIAAETTDISVYRYFDTRYSDS